MAQLVRPPVRHRGQTEPGAARSAGQERSQHASHADMPAVRQRGAHPPPPSHVESTTAAALEWPPRCCHRRCCSRRPDWAAAAAEAATGGTTSARLLLSRVGPRRRRPRSPGSLPTGHLHVHRGEPSMLPTDFCRPTPPARPPRHPQSLASLRSRGGRSATPLNSLLTRQVGAARPLRRQPPPASQGCATCPSNRPAPGEGGEQCVRGGRESGSPPARTTRGSGGDRRLYSLRSSAPAMPRGNLMGDSAKGVCSSRPTGTTPQQTPALHPHLAAVRRDAPGAVHVLRVYARPAVAVQRHTLN